MLFPLENSSTLRSCCFHEGMALGEFVNRSHCTPTATSSGPSHISRIVSPCYVPLQHTKRLSSLVLFGTFAEARSRDFSEDDDDEFAEDYGYSSDSDLEEDRDFETRGSVKSQDTTSPRQREASYYEYEENTQSGKVIKVQDIAFIT